MKTNSLIILLAAGLILSGCNLGERSFCSTDADCLECEDCVEGLCVLDESRLNACGECGPEPEEICDDGLDNDCDGHTDENCSELCEGVVCDQPPGPCHLEEGICSNGVCTYQRKPEGTACDDGDVCTAADECHRGACSGTPVTCDTPPPNECIDAYTMRSYAAEGTCVAGSCSYGFQDVSCQNGCADGACTGDPCAGVVCDQPPGPCYENQGVCSQGSCSYPPLADGTTCDDGQSCTLDDVCTSGVCSGAPMICDTPPPSECIDDNTLRSYESEGYCRNGACSYNFQDMPCANGCSNGACEGDPCAGVACDNPPADECITSTTRRTYSEGYCDQGSCVYPYLDEYCENGCLDGQCQSGSCNQDVYEPDDDSANAKLLLLDSAQTHSLCPVGDEDWLSFVVVVFARVTLETSGASGDTRMWLYDSGLTELEYNDDGGTNYFSLIEIDLAPGQYFVKIDEYNDNEELESYSLSASACIPDCAAVECGPDPVCGADCGGCPAGEACGNRGTCVTGREENWSYLTGGSVLSSPAVAVDGTVYVGSHDYKLYAFNPDGTVKWSYTTGGAIYSSPAVAADGTVYIGSDDYQVYAINPDGTFKWSFETGGYIDSSPAIGHDGTVFIGSQDNLLYAINPDGTLKWSYQTGGDVDSAPSISEDGVVYVGSDDDKLYALTQNGDLLWTYTTGDDVHASPALGADGTIYVGSHDGKLYALNPDGTLKWSYATLDIVRSSAAIAADGTLYVGSVDGSLYAVRADGSLKWSFATSDEIRSSAAIGADGTVYFGSYESRLYALNPNGSLRWISDEMTDSVFSSPALAADGTLYIGSHDYRVYAIDGDGPLEDSPWPKFRKDSKNTGRQ